jgi:hypothetical protein
VLAAILLITLSYLTFLLLRKLRRRRTLKLTT